MMNLSKRSTSVIRGSLGVMAMVSLMFSSACNVEDPELGGQNNGNNGANNDNNDNNGNNGANNENNGANNENNASNNENNASNNENNGNPSCADITCSEGSTCELVDGAPECFCPDNKIDLEGDGSRCVNGIDNVEVLSTFGSHTAVGAQSCLRVACPSGKAALHGGLTFQDRTNSAVVDVTSSTNVDGDGNWDVCTVATQPGEWGIDVVCADVYVPLTREREIVNARNESLCVVAKCPAGTRVVGGGGLTEQFDADHSRPTGENEWMHCGIANGAVELHTMAVCVEDDTISTRVREARMSDDVARRAACIDISCEPGETALGGGGYWGHNRALGSSSPLDGLSGWEVCAAPNGPAASDEWWVHAICLAP